MENNGSSNDRMKIKQILEDHLEKGNSYKWLRGKQTENSNKISI